MKDVKNHIHIKYCSKCRFLTRSIWLTQELLITFGDIIHEVSLLPSKEGGIFQILLNDKIIWDRKIDGNNPDLKLIKQKIRDIISPNRDLGHSDKTTRIK